MLQHTHAGSWAGVELNRCRSGNLQVAATCKLLFLLTASACSEYSRRYSCQLLGKGTDHLSICLNQRGANDVLAGGPKDAASNACHTVVVKLICMLESQQPAEAENLVPPTHALDTHPLTQPHTCT
jgi:hypothetical protein